MPVTSQVHNVGQITWWKNFRLSSHGVFTPSAVGLFQSLVTRSGTLSRVLSGTRRSVQTVSDVYLKRYCLLDTSASGSLEVFDDNCAI